MNQAHDSNALPVDVCCLSYGSLTLDGEFAVVSALDEPVDTGIIFEGEVRLRY